MILYNTISKKTQLKCIFSCIYSFRKIVYHVNSFIEIRTDINVKVAIGLHLLQYNYQKNIYV